MFAKSLCYTLMENHTSYQAVTTFAASPRRRIDRAHAQVACTSPVRAPIGAGCVTSFSASPIRPVRPGVPRLPRPGTANNPHPGVAPDTRNRSHSRSRTPTQRSYQPPTAKAHPMFPPRHLSRDPCNDRKSHSHSPAQLACTNPVRGPMGASCAAVFPQGDFLPRTAKASPGPARCAHEPSLPPSTGTANNPPPWVAPHRRNPSRICIRSSNTQPQSQPPRQIDQPRSRSRNRQPQPPWHAARRNGRTPPAPPVEVQYGLSEPGHWLDKQPDDRGSSNAAHADREDKKPPWKRAPPVWRDACGNGVAQAALSYTTSHSPVQDNGTALPDDRWFVVSGRGSTEADAKPMRLPEVDSPMKLRCPHAWLLVGIVWVVFTEKMVK
jgi:hypothetical protein